ncbi:hypothetical protein L665_02356 [Ralstonia solanacearum SD54]|nr:hypothetical protein L665_02356 [Ralstonia solanacearum SD54]
MQQAPHRGRQSMTVCSVSWGRSRHCAPPHSRRMQRSGSHAA